MAVEELSSGAPHLRMEEGSPCSSQRSGYGSGTSGASWASGKERPNEVAPGIQPLQLCRVLLSPAATQTSLFGSSLERKIKRGQGAEKR